MSDNEERQPENWELEWENYFDDLDYAIDRLLGVADRAEREGLFKAQVELVLAAADLEIVAKRCKDFMNLRIIELQTNIYKQNPLLKLMMENAKRASPFYAERADPDDSSQPD